MLVRSTASLCLSVDRPVAEHPVLHYTLPPRYMLTALYVLALVL